MLKEGEVKTEEKMESGEAVVEKVERKMERNDGRIGVTGIAYIYSTYNNTIIHITDLANNTIAQVSGGKITKHSRLKATPTVAMFAAKRAAEVAKEAGITEIYVRISSAAGSATPGPGAHSAVKSLGKEGLRIINILDDIPMPRGGPKKKGGKRGRRV